jgi:hypothetical protein
MKQVGFAFLGFCTGLLCLTLLTPGYLWIGASYALLLYALFFSERPSATALLIGFTVGLELLGTHRFGAATLTSVLVYGLFILFGQQLRFTSPYPRYIVAMLVSLALITGILYPVRGYGTRALGLLLVALVCAGIGGLLQRFRERTPYELL